MDESKDIYGKKYCVDCGCNNPVGNQGMCLVCWPEEKKSWNRKKNLLLYVKRHIVNSMIRGDCY
jgi:NMD protein affecting ribosome stability and mRNA decay